MGMRATLGQNFRFGYFGQSPLERMKAIRRAGFEDVMLWWGDEFAESDGTPRQLWRLARAQGLKVRTVHFPSTFAHHLWLAGEEGRQYEQALIAAVADCAAFQIEHLVVHTTRQLITPEPNALGAARLGRVLQRAESEGVNIALENTRFLRYNQYLYHRLDSPRLKFCFDSGHANCYTPNEDPLALFGDRLCSMHLHDNCGPQAGDQHLPIGEGTVDFARLFRRLAALSPTSYNLESHVCQRFMALTMEDYLTMSYRRLAEGIERAANEADA